MDAPEMRQGYRDRFVSDVEKHSAAISNGESATANKMHKRLHKLYSEVKEKNMTDIFPEFFVSDQIPLRFWSAVFSLKTAPEKSIQALTEIADPIPSLLQLPELQFNYGKKTSWNCCKQVAI